LRWHEPLVAAVILGGVLVTTVPSVHSKALALFRPTATGAGQSKPTPVVSRTGPWQVRVKGLSLAGGSGARGLARLEIYARVDRRDQSRMQIEARLLHEDTGRVVWERDYQCPDLEEGTLKEIVSAVLRDAMVLTREGGALTI
jgi:hypothetical protein